MFVSVIENLETDISWSTSHAQPSIVTQLTFTKLVRPRRGGSRVWWGFGYDGNG